jgi:hypothetical protein
MTHTDEGNTMMHLVAALRVHIAHEEKERRRNPEAWLVRLPVTTQQQWAILECIRTERERREAQAHAARTGDWRPALEVHPPAPHLRASHDTCTGLPAHSVR